MKGVEYRGEDRMGAMHSAGGCGVEVDVTWDGVAWFFDGRGVYTYFCGFTLIDFFSLWVLFLLLLLTLSVMRSEDVD